MIYLTPPGPYLLLFRAMDRLGWYKYHSARELSGATGISRRQVQRMLSALERNNLVRIRYDLDTGAKLVRPSRDTIEFSDGYVVYVYTHGIFGGVEVRFPRFFPHNRNP